MDARRVRLDGIFFRSAINTRTRMWRNMEGTYFHDKKIHNGEINGVPGARYLSPYRLLHYGYVDSEKVAKKYSLYSSVDTSGNRSYEHIKEDASVFCLPYVEFKNKKIHIMFLYLNKYFLSGIQQFARVYYKIKSFSK
jgi:hypothetical protein